MRNIEDGSQHRIELSEFRPELLPVLRKAFHVETLLLAAGLVELGQIAGDGADSAKDLCQSMLRLTVDFKKTADTADRNPQSQAMCQTKRRNLFGKFIEFCGSKTYTDNFIFICVSRSWLMLG